MFKLVCENCHNVFEVEKLELVIDCPKCGSSETAETNKVAQELAEYEYSQES